jgi:mono/diheme cytochrome c family protein
MRLRALALVPIVLALAACGGGKTVGPFPKTVIGTVPKAPTVAKGDPAKGKALFASSGCGGCHTFKPAGTNGKVGPDLDKLAADAQKANQGSLEQYTFDSIKNPSAYVVPGYPNGVMPNYGAQLNDQQIADLVAFLTKKS